MNNSTGALISPDAFTQLSEPERKQFTEVKRDLTALETANMQIRLYSPCGCGSGKKFKFCCKTKPTA